MYIATVPNRSSPPAILLRESFREDGKVKNRTLANLSHLPAGQIDLMRRVLKGETLLPADQALRIVRSKPHGHVAAVRQMIDQLGLEQLIAPRPSRERDLVLAMIVQRVIRPCSKLGTTRHWHATTLAEELGVSDATHEELYGAMDWLLKRQPRIEAKLAARHLSEDSLVLYDVSSSYYEGRSCNLARYGHNRDGKKDRPIIVFGLLTDDEGRPISLSVYPGNTADPRTVPDQMTKLQQQFGLRRVVLVGDRGMLTEPQIANLKENSELGWISALRSSSIRRLVVRGELQPSLFDSKDLAEIHSPDFPGERLVACFNPFLADERARKRQELLQRTEGRLERIRAEVQRRRRKQLTKTEIALKVGRVIDRYKMAKHFDLTIEDGRFAWTRNEAAIAEESALDGIYVIRTSESQRRLSAANAVRGYKRLIDVERAFRNMKSPELAVRPIYHRTDDRVRAHFFVCMLAYYVQWHLKRAWAPLLFNDEELTRSRTRYSPVARAEPSPSAHAKKETLQTSDGRPVHSFLSLLAELATHCRHECLIGPEESATPFQKLSEPTPLQAQALRLIEGL